MAPLVVFLALALAMVAIVVLVAAVWSIESEVKREMEKRWPGRS